MILHVFSDSVSWYVPRPNPKQVCSGGATMRPTKQDIFSASTEWLDLTSASGEHHSAEVSYNYLWCYDPNLSPCMHGLFSKGISSTWKRCSCFLPKHSRSNSPELYSGTTHWIFQVLIASYNLYSYTLLLLVYRSITRLWSMQLLWNHQSTWTYKQNPFLHQLLSHSFVSKYNVCMCRTDATCIVLTGMLFTGKNHEVLTEDGTPVLCNDGKPRLGKGFAESTFRKYYHALNTLHKHFRKEHSYRVSTLVY